MRYVLLLILLAININSYASSSKLTSERMDFLNEKFPHIAKIFGVYSGVPMVPYQPRGEEDTCVLRVFPVVLFDDGELISFTIQLSYLDKNNDYREVVFDNGIHYSRFLKDKTNYLRSANEGGLAHFELLSAPLNVLFGVRPTNIKFNFEEDGKLVEFYIDKKILFAARSDPYNRDLGCTDLTKLSDHWNLD